MESVDFLILFVVAFFAFWIIYPKARSYFSSKYMHMLLKRRVDKAIDDSLSSNSGSVIETKDTDIGLGARKNSLFDNALIQTIITKNKERFDEIKILLIKAGMRDEDSFEKYILYNNILFGFALSVLVFYCIKTHITIALPMPIEMFASIVIGIILAVYISDLNLKSKAKSRQDEIDRGVPDLIDLLAICSDSGLDLHRAIMRVSREIRNSNIELSDEFTITAIEMEMIPDSKQVLNNLAERTDSLQIKSLAKALSQSIEYGSSLTEMLKELSQESRQKRMLSAEERAARIPTLMTIPLMLFILPCLFIVMLGPIVADVMQTFE